MQPTDKRYRNVYTSTFTPVEIAGMKAHLPLESTVGRPQNKTK